MMKETTNIEEDFLSKLSSEQKEFVQFNNNNALVSASAGSGKTFTMINKLVALIVYYHVNIDDLLVVTFTNSAGEELKQKLYNGLLKELSTTKNTSIDKDKLYSDLERINTCDIGTLHSVCFKYIMKYFYKCGVSPTSTILSEEDTNYLLNQAINNVIAEYVDDEVFYALFNAYSNKRNNLKIINIIKSIYYFMQSIPDVDYFVNNVINNEKNKQLDTNICANYIVSTLKDSFNESEKTFKELLIEAESLELEKYVESIGSILRAITEYRNCNNYIEVAKLLNNGFEIARVSKPRNASVEVLDFAERYKYHKERFSDVIKNLKTYFLSENENDILNIEKQILQNVNKCIEIVTAVDQEYKKLKENKDGLDYNDLEHGMLKLLADDVVLGELKNKYKYIFVDEYQDINNVQESILTKLSNGKNLYMIGDVKQSIYGFRLCTPDIFIEKYNTYKNNLKSGKSIEFNRNFRSVDNILQFVNYIFECIGTPNTMGIDYKASSMLQCGKEINGNSEDSVDVEVNIIDKVSKEEDENSEDEETLEDNADIEAKLVVNKVQEYLTKKYLNLDTKEYVNIEPKDIAIIIRDKSKLSLKVYLELQNANIPVNTELKLDLFDAFEINLLTSYLKLLSNPNDDLSMVTVLRSHMVGLTDEELMAVRNAKKFGTYVDAVEEYINSVDDEVTYKIKSLKNDLEYYRFKLSNDTLKGVVTDIVTRYNLMNYFGSMPDGIQKKSNIEIFVNLLNNQNYEYNLSKFLDYVELLKNKEYSTSVQNGLNAVTIMTMHKSKGLDYPVVILAELGKRFSIQTLKSDAIMSSELGIGLKYNNVVNRTTTNTISYMANRLSKELSERREQIRLYYVALTRAKNYLCLIGTYDMLNINNIKNRDVLKCNSFLELTMYAMFKHQNNTALYNPKSTIHISDNNAFNIQIYTPNDISNREIVKKLQVKENKLFVDNDLVNKLKSSFMYIYPYTKKKNIARKTSVSTMLNDVDYVEQNYEPQELVIGESIVNTFGIDVGNAYHAIMERINYNGEDNVLDIMKSLVSQGVISEKISKHIDIKKIQIAIDNIRKLITKDTKILKEQQFMIRDKHSNLVNSSSDETLVMVQGIIDLVLIDKDKSILIDFKTNKISEEELIEKYRLQIDLYSKAIEGATGTKVKEKYLYSFHLNKLINL